MTQLSPELIKIMTDMVINNPKALPIWKELLAGYNQAGIAKDMVAAKAASITPKADAASLALMLMNVMLTNPDISNMLPETFRNMGQGGQI